MATSFIVDAEAGNEDFYAFMQRYKEISQDYFAKEKLPSKHCKQNIWLLKPSNMNQGRGIELFRNIREAKQILSKKTPHTHWVIQKYIERPLLYQDRKFDIRVWVLVTDRVDVKETINIYIIGFFL